MAMLANTGNAPRKFACALFDEASIPNVSRSRHAVILDTSMPWRVAMRQFSDFCFADGTARSQQRCEALEIVLTATLPTYLPGTGFDVLRKH